MEKIPAGYIELGEKGAAEGLQKGVNKVVQSRIRWTWLSTSYRVLEKSADNTTDWTVLDLSDKVTKKTAFIVLVLNLKHSSADKTFGVRKKGTTPAYYTVIRNQVANIYITSQAMVACDSDRKVEYKCSVANATTLVIDLLAYGEQE